MNRLLQIVTPEPLGALKGKVINDFLVWPVISLIYLSLQLLDDRRFGSDMLTEPI